MPKGYWVLHVDVNDEDRYKEYLRLDGLVFEEFEMTPVVRGGRFIAPEGDAKSRHVVLEFESFEKAVECYNSPGYQEAVKHRLAASDSEIVIVEGV